MKKYSMVLFFMLLMTTLSAQSIAPTVYTISDAYNWWNMQNGDEAITFADVAYVRDSPHLNGRIVDSLQHGIPVKIISKGYNLSTIRGFQAPWHKISYQTEGIKKEGYIWLGLLALGKESNSKGESFIHGFLRKNKQTDDDFGSYLLEIKCLDKANNIIARAHYPADLYEQTFTEHKMLSNMGLEGLESIHRIAFLGEACGVSSCHYYFGWTGQQLIPLLDKTSVSDAGIFYYQERILFPSEHHLKSDLILKDIEEGEVIDAEASDLEFKITKKRKKYTWDGKIISEVMELK